VANIQQRRSKDGLTTYRVQVRKSGFPAQTATFARKTDARAWAAATEAAIDRGKHLPRRDAQRRTLADLVDRYLEHVARTKPHALTKQTQLLSFWKAHLGRYALAHVTPARIADARDALYAGSTNRGTPRSPATINRYIAALGSAMSVAMREWHWIEDNPVRRVSKNTEGPGRVRYLSREELTALLRECAASPSSDLELIVRLALSTGMRAGEVIGITWDDVDLDRGLIVLHKTKNRERRAVPVAARVRELLEARRGARRDGVALVFPGANPSKPITIRKPFESAVARAGLVDFRFHDLRHTAASYLAMSGATLPEIAAVLGHKTLSMVKRYAHLSEQHTSAVVQRMADKFLSDADGDAVP